MCAGACGGHAERVARIGIPGQGLGGRVRSSLPVGICTAPQLRTTRRAKPAIVAPYGAAKGIPLPQHLLRLGPGRSRHDRRIVHDGRGRLGRERHGQAHDRGAGMVQGEFLRRADGPHAGRGRAGAHSWPPVGHAQLAATADAAVRRAAGGDAHGHTVRGQLVAVLPAVRRCGGRGADLRRHDALPHHPAQVVCAQARPCNGVGGNGPRSWPHDLSGLHSSSH